MVLIEIPIILCKTDTHEIMSCVAATNVLETRLTEADFLTLMAELETELMAA